MYNGIVNIGLILDNRKCGNEGNKGNDGKQGE